MRNTQTHTDIFYLFPFEYNLVTSKNFLRRSSTEYILQSIIELFYIKTFSQHIRNKIIGLKLEINVSISTYNQYTQIFQKRYPFYFCTITLYTIVRIYMYFQA